jgi:putative glutamine transport system substrate-binding protein
VSINEIFDFGGTNVKRRLFILFVIATLLAGCADLASLLPEREEEGLPSAHIAPTPVPTYPPEMSTVARMLARDALVVGVRYDLEPFSYVTPDSQLAGLEIDLARELARRWLGDPEAVRFRQVRTDSAFRHLAEGTVDIVLAGVIHTQEMEAQADFSPPYFMNGLALLTFPDAGIQSFADVGDRTLGVVGWTGSRARIQETLAVSTTYSVYDDFFDVIEALRVREIDAYAGMRHRLERARRRVAGSTIVGQATWQPMALVYREDDPFFANLVTLTFQDMALDGTRDALYARWLPGASPPNLVVMPGGTPTPALSAAPAQRATLDVLARIQARGSVALGYFNDRWPYSADRADGVPTGFEVRLMERVVERWLGSRQAITFVPVTEADALNRLQAGEVDLLVGNWLRTRELELVADTSVSVLDDGVSIFSLAAAPVEDLAGLNGQPVGVVTGSPGEAALPSLLQAAGVGATVNRYPDVEGALNALNGGEVVAVVGARRALLEVHFTQPGYFMTDRRYTYRPVAYVVPQGDSAYRDLLNLTLAALEADGTYRELYSLWFDDPVPDLRSWPGKPAVPLVIQGEP